MRTHLPPSNRVLASLFLSSLVLALVSICDAATTGPYQATGIKICEPSSSGVSIWTRATQSATAAPNDRPLPEVRVFDRVTGKEMKRRDNAMEHGRIEISFPDGSDWQTIPGAASGAPGQTRVKYRRTGDLDWSVTPWGDVDPARDFTRSIPLTELQAGTSYEIKVETRPVGGIEPSSVIDGGFRTVPPAESGGAVTFCVMTCQQYEDRDRPDGFSIYPSMLRLNPDFFVNTGDAVYYDHGPVHGLNPALARYKWARMFSQPTLREFHRHVGSYFMKDDHDTLTDDSRPGDSTGELTFAEGQKIFCEQTALPDPPYRTIRWGRHLQVWLMEGRDFRQPRNEDLKGKPPTIWGPQQIEWLTRTLNQSDATFFVLITPEPIIGPDRAAKDDNYSNAGYSVEGDAIRQLLSKHRNLILVTGDRHWQYVSIDSREHLEEWSVGAASDAHAGGWTDDMRRPEHRFLRTTGGGFLSGRVETLSGRPELTLQLHDTQGKVLYENTRSAP